MNAQEKQLIEDLFARLRNFDGGEKDQDAEWLIQDLIRRSPDAPYYLAQTVIVQQQALERAEARMRELEAAARQPQSTGRGGSFLGGSSVPQSGSRYTPSYSPQQGPGPVAPPAANPSSNSPWASPAQAAGGGGGFLSSALSTAAGVAGGVFLADGIRSLFGGGRAYAGGDATSAADQKTIDNLQDQAQDARDDADQAQRDLAADDAAQDEMQDAQDDGQYDWGSDDFDV
ncbi:DUF2076 domain-containing protein [Hyphomicrobium sp.]|uniref:DUF2076 domain-containing protein n=1 Tax=Hyphomicrobium sp. TaxID=82 RepID=UPI001DE2AD55|nr:DUF2076 domain-containing protein [Hyphomicrobium sp.]MBY0560587.1 DUF2076 domain-containing protein [Hyphomicrobium sp.]